MSRNCQLRKTVYALLDRKLPTYDSMKHDDGSYGRPSTEFAHDYRTPSRGKYKQAGGVRVYEGGCVEVTSCVYNNPAMRYCMAETYGLQFATKGERRGLVFYTPNGDKVYKKDIDNELLFLDKQTMRAYGYRWRNYVGKLQEEACITFMHKDAVPVAHSTIQITAGKPDQVAKALKTHEELLRVARVTRELMGAPPRGMPWLSWWEEVPSALGLKATLAAMLAGEPLGDMPPERLAALGSPPPAAFRSQLYDASKEQHLLPWLRIEVQGGA